MLYHWTLFEQMAKIVSTLIHYVPEDIHEAHYEFEAGQICVQ